jgi:Domain of unknown function (DUF4278)
MCWGSQTNSFPPSYSGIKATAKNLTLFNITPQKAKFMKLSYRGDIYEYNPVAIDMVEGEIGGKYRGQSWTVRYPRHIPVPQPVLDLKYRGVAYRTGTDTVAKPVMPDGAIATTPAVCDSLSETHLASIRRRLEHRLRVAKDHNNESLIQMLEAECRQFVGNCR